MCNFGMRVNSVNVSQGKLNLEANSNFSFVEKYATCNHLGKQNCGNKGRICPAFAKIFLLTGNAEKHQARQVNSTQQSADPYNSICRHVTVNPRSPRPVPHE